MTKIIVPMTKKRKHAIIILSILAIIVIFYGCSYIPMNATMISSNMAKIVKSHTIASITIVTEPCCGPQEGPRRTTVITDTAAIATIQSILKRTKAQREPIINFSAGGGNMRCSVLTTSGKNYKFALNRGSIVLGAFKFTPINKTEWDYLRQTFDNTVEEIEWKK